MYDRPKEDGGGYTCISLYADCLKVESAPSYYDIYDCFFNCIHQSLQIKDGSKGFCVPDLRKKMKIASNVEVPIRSIKHFERAANIKVVVHKDSLGDDDQPFKAYDSNFSSRFVAYLLLHNSHYYVYKGIVEKYMRYNGDDECNYKCNLDVDFDCFMFYDLETYMEPVTYNVTPYAMSYIIYDKTTKGKIAQCDRGVIYKTNIDDNFAIDIYQVIHNKVGDKRVLLIGYNNSVFDDYVLIDLLSKYNAKLVGTVIDNKGKILEFRYNRLKSKDMFRFMLTSLKKASEGFKCNVTKGELNHHEVQRFNNNNTYGEWIKNNKELLVDYAIKDVISLSELYFKSRMIFKEINEDLVMDHCLTLSQMSMTAFKMSLLKSIVDGKGKYLIKLPIVNNNLFD